MTPVLQLIIDNLKASRDERNLTQKEVAKRCGMLGSTYSRLESGQASPQIHTLERICDAIGITVPDLFVPLEVSNLSILQKLEAIEQLSDINRTILDMMMDTVIEKDRLEKAQNVKMRKRLEELGKAKRGK